MWPVLEQPPAGAAVHVVRAAHSDRWGDDVVGRLERLSARQDLSYHVLPNAGHWLHMENPTGLADMIAPELVGLAQANQYSMRGNGERTFTT